MKKLYIALSIGLMTGTAYSACIGPYCWDDTGANITGSISLNPSGTITTTGITDTGNASVSGTLGVTGTSTLSDTVTASKGVAATTMTLTGASTLSGALTLSSPSGVAVTYDVRAASATIPILNGAIAVGGTITETYGVSAATITATGLTTLGNTTAYSLKISSITAEVPSGTPTAAGLIAFDTNYVMYVSTGTGAGAWVKIGGQ